MTDRLSKICEICGRTFYKSIDVRPKTFATRRFCSHKCRAKAQSDASLTDWSRVSCNQSFRWKARKLLLNKCAICGWDEAPCDVAHIIPGIDDIQNVLMLCPNHHRMYDRGLISKEAIMEAKEATDRDWMTNASIR